MAQEPCQFHQHGLIPVPITYDSLKHTLQDFRRAIGKGVSILKTQCQPAERTKSSDTGNIFKGDLGLALLFLRLQRQERVISSTHPEDSSDLVSPHSSRHFLDLAAQFGGSSHLKASASTERHDVSGTIKDPNSSVSPLTSSVSGPAFVRLLAAIQGAEVYPCLTESKHNCQTNNCCIALDLEHLEADITEALEGPSIIEKNGHKLGRDEILVGRAGMVWALGYLSSSMSSIPHSALLKDRDIAERLEAAISKVKLLVRHIISQGASHDAKDSEDEMPLLWPWLNNYYGLGAVHGATGILATILSPNLNKTMEEEDSKLLDEEDIRQMIRTVTGICRKSMDENGHLAMSVPAFPSRSTRASPLVQICHGSPGLLQLLSITKQNPATYEIWRNRQGLHEHSIWSQAFTRSSDVVWREGLVAKGGGLCHGIAGNAWPWLTMSIPGTVDADRREKLPSDSHNKRGDEDTGVSAEECLGKALTFLLEARNTRPFTDYDDSGHPTAASASTGRVYLLPDKPFGLFTGLAGTVAAWAEACVVIVYYLRRMEIEKESSPVADNDSIIAYAMSALLGFPGLS